MLDTVLLIGKALRNSPNALKHNQSIDACPPDTEKSKVLRLSIPVTKDFQFDLMSLSEITDENIIKEKSFYLKFKIGMPSAKCDYLHFGRVHTYAGINQIPV